MGGERRGDQDRIDILAPAVPGSLRRLRLRSAAEGDALLQIGRVDVAYRDTAAALQARHVAQQVPTLCAGADDSVGDLLAGPRALWDRMRRACRGPPALTKSRLVKETPRRLDRKDGGVSPVFVGARRRAFVMAPRFAVTSQARSAPGMATLKLDLVAGHPACRSSWSRGCPTRGRRRTTLCLAHPCRPGSALRLPHTADGAGRVAPSCFKVRWTGSARRIPPSATCHFPLQSAQQATTARTKNMSAGKAAIRHLEFLLRPSGQANYTYSPVPEPFVAGTKVAHIRLVASLPVRPSPSDQLAPLPDPPERRCRPGEC